MKRFFAASLIVLLMPIAVGAAPKGKGAAAPPKATAAVLDPKATGLSAEHVDILAEAIRDAVVNATKYRVQDQAAMREILKQQAANASEICDESCAVQQGRLLQVKYLLTSTVRRVGDETWVSIRMTDVESGEVTGAARGSCSKCDIKAAVKVAEDTVAKVLGGTKEIEPPPPPPPPVINQGPVENRYLEEARKLATKGKYSAALEELDLAEGVLTNSVRQWADIFALKATCNLLKPVPDDKTAKQALLDFLHYDAKGDLGGLPEMVKAKLEQVKTERVAVLHNRLVVVRAGRPVKVKARVNDPQNKVAGVTLFYRLRGEEAFKSDILDRGPIDFSGYVRAAPPAGSEVDVEAEYYLSATDPEGNVLDLNGTAARPIRFVISFTLAEQEGAGELKTLAFADETAIKPPPPPEPPFYSKWWFWTIVGVAAAGGTTAAIIANQPEPANGTLGRIDLP